MRKYGKVEIILEKSQVAFLSPSENSENLNFSTVRVERFKFSELLLGDKKATYLSSKTISTLYDILLLGCLGIKIENNATTNMLRN